MQGESHIDRQKVKERNEKRRQIDRETERERRKEGKQIEKQREKERERESKERLTELGMNQLEVFDERLSNQ